MIDKIKRKLWLAPYILVLIGACFLWFALAMTDSEVMGETAEGTAFEADDALRREIAAFLPMPGEPGEDLADVYDPARAVVIDAGHGGLDSGCVWDDEVEKDVNLNIAVRLREILEELDYYVIMTRTEDELLSPAERAVIANAYNAAAFVSIHQNSYEDTSVHGIETWYDPDEEKDSHGLAKMLHEQLVLKTGAEDRGLRPDDGLLVTRQTTMPACLVETGYMSNDTERGLLLSDEYIEKIARGLANGIDQFLTPKVMYLTFDDGPSEKYTAGVLDILKARGIKATFFVVGENVRKNPELTQRIVNEGHTIGIHCDRHVYKEIYASVENYISDFNRASDSVFEITGVRPQIFRFPGGSVNSYNRRTYKDIINAMQDLGYVYFDWNACVDDAIKIPNKDDVMQAVKNGLVGKNRVILLAHDPVAKTLEYLNDMLDLFSDYYMAAITPDTEPIRFRLK